MSWLLLGLLALRGLVPAGYMIDTSGGAFALVVCGSGIYSAAAQTDPSSHAEHDQHHGHHGHHDDDGNPTKESASSDHSICPFAIAAAGAPLPVLPAMDPIASTEIDRVVDTRAFIFGPFGPSRAQQSRAPPSFS